MPRLLPDALKIFDQFAGRLPAEQRRVLDERRDGESLRIAHVLAAWQSNGHAFPLRGEQEDIAAVRRSLHHSPPSSR